jgi:hypothetical protein
MQNEVQVGNVGTVFKVRIVEDGLPVNVTAATTREIIFKPPKGNTLTRNASLYTDGADGIITYSTGASDLTSAGQWYLQAHIEFTGSEYYTEVVGFTVRANL